MASRKNVETFLEAVEFGCYLNRFFVFLRINGGL